MSGRAWWRRPLDVLSSPRSAVVLLLVLFVLTWLGTLHQVDHGLHAAQQKYFDSWLVVEELGPIPLPLPGGYLALLLLFVNLLVGGLIRIRWHLARAGVLVVHLGIALMLVAGFVKFHYSSEGFLRLYEGEQAGQYEDYYRWEVVISRELDDGSVREYLIDERRFLHLDETWRRFHHPELPFELELARFMPNATPLPKGPMFEAPTPVVDGWFLQPQDRNKEAESNVAGLYARLAAAPDRPGLLWGADVPPWTVEAQGERFGIALRHRRYPLPFAVRLDDFHHEFHPGTRTARVFRSDVTVVDASATQGQRIEMNEPLRRDGIIMFQASYGPPDARPGERMYSVFQVVENPSDQWPLVSCIVIALGLVWHFGGMLLRYIRRTNLAATRPERQGGEAAS